MAVCKFFQQGNCKFGNSCRFEHPTSSRDQSSYRGSAQPTGAGRNGNYRGSEQDLIDKFGLSTDVIEKDLTSERPTWILSCYGPGRSAPDQLFGGFPREQSFEELRLHYLTGKASGKEQEALAEAQMLYQNAEQQTQKALGNVREAILFIADGEHRHPNRNDICRQGTQGTPFGEFLVGKRQVTTLASQSSAFGSNANTTSFGGGAPPAGALGQPSALGQRANPFASTNSSPQPPLQPQQPASAFGQAAPANSAFGQPSAMGAKPNPFGAPAFGQAAQPASQGGAFGQPSQLGAKPNPFASTTTATTSPFAAAAQAADSNQAAPNPFASNANTNTGASPFGAFANDNNSTNQTSTPFGGPGPAAPSAFGSAPARQSNPSSNNPFGQTTQSSSAFGKPASPAANPFGSLGSANQAPQTNAFAQQTSTSSFGQAQSNASPFAKQAAPEVMTNGDSAMASQAPQQSQNANTAGSAPPSGNGRQHPPIESYITKGADSRIASFKGKAVSYKAGKPGIRDFSGVWTRIWFPDGPPTYNKDTELRPEMYDEKSRAEWDAFAQTGTFQDGLMPVLPPPRECTRWDL